MSLKGTISSALTSVLFFIYTDTVEQITKKLGIHSALASLYWSVQSRFHESEATTSVAGREATFTVSTVWEYYRFHDLLGEDVIIADLLSELRSDDVFYDVGANVGMYTCFVAQELPEEQVMAFEPHPENASRLQTNLDLNGVDATIQQYGLSDTEMEAALAVGPDESGEGRHSLAVADDEATLPIQLRKGDSLIADGEVPPPTTMKIDVEGAEVGVLEGLEQALRDHCRLCYVEVHPDRLSNYGHTMEDFNSLFESTGFETTVIHERGEDEFFVKAEKRET